MFRLVAKPHINRVGAGRISRVAHWSFRFLSKASSGGVAGSAPPPPPPDHTPEEDPSLPSHNKLTDVLKAATASTYTNDGKLLYMKSQHFTVRLMCAVTGVNAMYWSSQLVMSQVFHDTVVQGVSLSGGYPLMNFLGLAGTGLFFYFTRSYAHHAVLQAYETVDGERIGFQVHTVLGYPGRKFEVPLGSARLANPSAVTHLGTYFLQHTQQELVERQQRLKKRNFLKMMFINDNSNVAVAVDGMQGNVVIDSHGEFPDAERLATLLRPNWIPGSSASVGNAAAGISSSLSQAKERRIEWKQSKGADYKRRKTRKGSSNR